ncbi:autotransporter assembly complex family protein, partial [Gemmatimonadota bacterium]
TADVALRFRTGPRFRFGDVTFDQDVVESELLRSFVRFERGEPFNVNELLALQSALGDSPYFSRVEVVPRREAAQDLEVPIDVKLVPRQTQQYEAGVGYGTNTGPRGTFEIELRRLNRVGHRASGEISASLIERRISTQYVIPVGVGKGNVLALSAGFAIASATLGRYRGRWQETLSLTFQLEDFQVGSDSGTAVLLMPGASWSRTKADDRLFPSRGSRVRFELNGALSGAGSNASFGRVKASAKFIRTVLPRTRLLARIDLGGTVTNQLHDLPPSIRFFSGGDQSVRGYAYRSLGPVDAIANVIGGRVLAVGGIELDREIISRFGIATFFDTGNAMDRFEWSLEQSVGGGVRWLSPVGLVRLDLAFAVSRDGNPLRFHLTVGPDL